jgi:hypothetical protein
MQVTAILKARAVALIHVDELNLSGNLRLVDIVSPLVQRYGFASFPTKPEDFEADKGIKFSNGKIGDKVISALGLFEGLISVESLSSTADSQSILEEMLEWGAHDLGLTYKPELIRHWAYISQISFNSDIALLSLLSKPLRNLARKTGKAVSGFFDEDLPYEVSKIIIGHDPMLRKNAIAGITIEHRVDTQFKENRFFSEAPLPTSSHIKFLEELEAETREL